MLNKFYKISILAGVLAPMITSAEILGKSKGLLEGVKSIVNTQLIPIVFSLALLLFFWGVVKYIWSEGNAKEDGKKIMIWGVVALFVMASIWGLVAFIQKALIGGPGPDSMRTPTIGGSGGSGFNPGDCAGEPGTADCP